MPQTTAVYCTVYALGGAAINIYLQLQNHLTIRPDALALDNMCNLLCSMQGPEKRFWLLHSTHLVTMSFRLEMRQALNTSSSNFSAKGMLPTRGLPKPYM